MSEKRKKSEILMLCALVILAGTILMVLPASAVTKSENPDGLYTVVKFTGAGTMNWTVPPGVTEVEYLVVGGGGGGGYHQGGGGGAGGYRTASGFAVSGNINVTVGTKGAGGTSSTMEGSDGGDSTFSSIVSDGGGGGGSATGSGSGRNGGSGGGSHGNYGHGTATAGQGNNGGDGTNTLVTSGGGGGKGGVGGTGNGTNSGNGGAGQQSPLTGDYYAGGGGAGLVSTAAGNPGTGGSSIGGNGSKTGAGGNAVANTGSGGGGGSQAANGGDGSDGVVIIRYLTPGTAAPVTSFTGSPLSGTSPLTVQFTDTSSNTPTAWSWNFGDSQTSTDQNPLHTFTSSGTFTVSLAATNAGGSNTTAKPDYITVSSPLPATSTVTTGNGYIEQPGEEIMFNLTLDHAPLGLSGYNVNITIGNPALAEITAISFPSWAQAMNSHGPLPGSQNVLMKASDVNNQVQAGASGITLGTITLRGLSPGSTTISLSSANFDDEGGLDMPLSLTTGNLTVNYSLTDPLIIDITPTQAYNNGTVNIVINGTGYV